ncbi:hypothetical protein ACP70R_045529 [Stipagrostis hirtigluma subsp. patula]
MPPPKRRREGGGDRGGGGGGGGGDGSGVSGGVWGSGGGDGGGGGGGGSTTPPSPPPVGSRAPALKRRCRSFDLEIRGCRHLQELTARVEAIETTLSRTIPEELRKVLASFFNHVPGARIEQNLPPTYKLSFVTSMSGVIFTKREVRAADEGQIKIRINQQGTNCPHILSANVKIVVLDGDFNADNRELWTSEEFDNHIVRPRDKVGAVLTGNLDVKLANGEAYLHDVTFVDNSSFTRSRKFRLGVKLIGDVGVRVQEGITEPFTVKDRRGEGYKKVDVPRLDDEVWCLQRIRKGGVFHEALKQAGILLVKHFLRLYYKDAKSLRNILSNASESVWTTIVDHAMKCDPGRALYSYSMEDKKTRLYFNSLGQIVGATIAGQYNAFGDLDMPWKAQVEEWCKDAYECMTYQKADYEMYNSQPRLINSSTLQELITTEPKSTEPTADEQDTSKGREVYGGGSHRCTYRRLGSLRVRTFPSAQENNGTDASFDIDVQLDSGPDIQNDPPGANYNAGLVTLHCPTSAADEIIASVALDQAAFTMHQEGYQMPFADEGPPSLRRWCTEQEVASQYAPHLSPSIQAGSNVFSTQNSFSSFSMDQLFEDLPADAISQFVAPNVSELQSAVGCGMEKLSSYSKWVKLTAVVKWMAILRASKSKAHA